MYDTRLADRIRIKTAAFHLPIDVVEVDGWRTRGREWPRRPSLALGHHTGNPNMGWAPSLGICINGRGGPSPVPGPLCQALRARKRDGRYTVFVIAAGVANHAGKGGYDGRTGNSTCYGLEVENNGTTEAWTDEAREVDALILAAMLDGGGQLACEHKEWAPQRKVDRHHTNGDDTRRAVLHYLAAPPIPEPPPTPEEIDMDFFILASNKPGDNGLHYWWPDLDVKGRRAIIPDGPAAEQARKSRRFCGDLKLDHPDLDAIPTLR